MWEKFIFFLIKRAAKKGDMYAQNDLGLMNYRLQKYNLSEYFYSKSAKQGYSLAQFRLGILYLNKSFANYNIKKAEYWLNEARNNNNYSISKMAEDVLKNIYDKY
jgi:TPR repeat protein